MNGKRFEDHDDRPEAFETIRIRVEDLLAMQQRRLGDAQAAWRRLGRLQALARRAEGRAAESGHGRVLVDGSRTGAHVVPSVTGDRPLRHSSSSDG